MGGSRSGTKSQGALGVCVATGMMGLFLLGLGSVPAWAYGEWSETYSIYPLPGQLNQVPMVNSNSPEVITSAGILVSTLPPLKPGDGSVYLDHALTGRFQVFAHHVAEPPDSSRQLHLGLLLSNPQPEPIAVRLLRGHSFLLTPDAPYRSLPPLISGWDSLVFSGPGDRLMANVLNQTENALRPSMMIPGQSTQLMEQWPVPVDWQWMRPRRNVRSTLLELESSGAVYSSLVAAWVPQGQKPVAETFAQVLEQRQLAGSREPAPTPLQFDTPVNPQAFRYGRVAGVSEGTQWQTAILGGQAPLGYLKPGETVGFPIAAVHLKRLGTTQNQSGRLLRRYPDTAYQSHGNYGVRYVLQADFNNDETAPQIYNWRLSHPLRVIPNEPEETAAQVWYTRQDSERVVFRGSLMMDWHDDQHHHQRSWHHVVLKEGQKGPVFFTVEVPPGEKQALTLTLIYPPDCVPPQLLSIEREQ